MEKGNGIKCAINMLVTNSWISIPPRVSDYFPIDISIGIWNCTGIACVSFLPNLMGLLSITRAPIMVVENIRVGDENARGILRITKMNNGFTKLMGFIGDVCLLWDSSKMFLVPHKFEPMHMTFVVKVNFALLCIQYTSSFYVYSLSLRR